MVRQLLQESPDSDRFLHLDSGGAEFIQFPGLDSPAPPGMSAADFTEFSSRASGPDPQPPAERIRSSARNSGSR